MPFIMDGATPKWFAVCALTILFLWLGHLTAQPLRGGPQRILKLELAATTAAANDFLRAWANAEPEKWKTKLNESLSWDTWFICAYAPLFTLLCWVAADFLAHCNPKLAALGRALAGGQLLAGALDFVENAAMKQMIDAGQAFAPWPHVSSLASGIKWLLIVAFVLFAGGATIKAAFTFFNRL